MSMAAVPGGARLTDCGACGRSGGKRSDMFGAFWLGCRQTAREDKNKR